jgi:hypothetical protein
MRLIRYWDGGLVSSLKPENRARTALADPFDLAAWIAITAVLVLALHTFRDYAISNDEEVQHQYGQYIVSYYTSGLVDHSLFHFKNLYLYGGLFDVIAVELGWLLPYDVFQIRHVLCALFGVGGMVAAWATARLIAGPRAGTLAVLALAVCGPWYGSMFNHTKDIPFAAAMMGAIYFLLRAARNLPRPRLADSLGFGLLLGAALGQRAMGLLLGFYALVIILWHAPRPLLSADHVRFAGRSMIGFMPGFALGYLVMIAAWPWAATGLLNPIRAIYAFSQFDYPVKTLLAGDIYLMGEVPRLYTPVYLAVKLPLVMLVGSALAIGLSMVLVRARTALGQAPRTCEARFIAFAAFFPVLCQVIGHGPAFSGIRHFIFIVPPLAVLAGLGFDRLLALLETRRQAVAAAALVVVGAWFAYTGSTLVRLHPYEYLFFNPLVGGLSGAAQRYDTDYWVNIMHEAVGDLENFLDREGAGARTYHVAVCGERLSFDKEAARRHRLTWATDKDPVDFFIAPTHLGCDRAMDGKVIVTIKRLGALIGVVKDRRSATRPNVAKAN